MIGKVIFKKTVLLLAMITAAFALSSGIALAATVSCKANIECFGTNKADTLVGTAGQDRVHGRGGRDLLKGFGDSDELYGDGGRDDLRGGASLDYLTGGPGEDTLSGGAGSDVYLFDLDWGRDFVNEGSGSSGIVFGEFFANAYPQSVVTDDLTIRFVPGPGPEVETADGINTVNWESNSVAMTVGGTGDDTISGNNLGNLIVGGSGQDIIHAAGGDDEISVADGSGGDTVECGEDLIFDADNDSVLYDPGDNVSNNCEEKVLAT